MKLKVYGHISVIQNGSFVEATFVNNNDFMSAEYKIDNYLPITLLEYGSSALGRIIYNIFMFIYVLTSSPKRDLKFVKEISASIKYRRAKLVINPINCSNDSILEISIKKEKIPFSIEIKNGEFGIEYIGRYKGSYRNQKKKYLIKL
ncbi:MAG: hypothetical protein WC907_08380 [Acholeplasmataceae bacterium]